jgi:hypothetical protein
MNERTLSQHYGKLTGEERFRLMLAAQARRDEAEMVSLMTSCPKVEVLAPDPNFCRWMHQVVTEVGAVTGHWVELSHYVVRYGLLTLALERDDIADARKGKATWKQLSAMWRGVESAITRFCTETELTPEQVLGPELPCVIEDARNHLHPGSRVDRATETGVLGRLHQAWGRPAA